MTLPRIHAIATANPPGVLARGRWIDVAQAIAPPEVERGVIERLASRSGIDTRHCAAAPPDGSCFYPFEGDGDPGTAQRMALWREAAGRMAVESSRAALRQSGIAAEAITHCITASCTGFESPGIDAELIESLGLPRTCRRLNVGFMGCHAAVNALAAARDAVRSDPAACALVCCTEVSSAHFQRSARLDRLVANTLFADGSAAVVVSCAPHGPAVLGTHTVLIPGTADEMRWTVGDHGFEMTLGARVPDILREAVRPWVDGALAAHGLRVPDVGGWAIHPGGPRVIDAVSAALGLPEAAAAESRAVLRTHGNMSSATLPFILERLMRGSTPLPWVGLAFGPGLVGEMVVLGAG
jgi:prepilin-type processing-associated H-X9-DG protein